MFLSFPLDLKRLSGLLITSPNWFASPCPQILPRPNHLPRLIEVGSFFVSMRPLRNARFSFLGLGTAHSTHPPQVPICQLTSLTKSFDLPPRPSLFYWCFFSLDDPENLACDPLKTIHVGPLFSSGILKYDPDRSAHKCPSPPPSTNPRCRRMSPPGLLPFRCP